MLNGVKRIINKSLLIFSVILFILLILLVSELLVTGVMIAMNNPGTFISKSTYAVDNENNRITFKIGVDIPKAGIVPKSLLINFEIFIAGRIYEGIRKINFGDNRLIELHIKLPQSVIDQANSQDLVISNTLWITPIYWGFEIESATRKIELGSTRV